MAEEDAKVVAKIQAEDDTAAGLKKAESSLKKWADRAGKAVNVASYAAVGLAVGAVVKSAFSAVDIADEIGKMSQKLGLSTEVLSVLRHEAELADVSFEGLAKGVKALSLSLVDAQRGGQESADAFKDLGINVSEFGTSGSEVNRLLETVADRFKGMEAGATKAALATSLFKRAGLDLIPLLNEGGEGLRSAAKDAERLGIVFSAQDTKNAEAFNDAITKMKAAMLGLGAALTQSGLLENLTKFIELAGAMIAMYSRMNFGEAAKAIWTGVPAGDKLLGPAEDPDAARARRVAEVAADTLRIRGLEEMDAAHAKINAEVSESIQGYAEAQRALDAYLNEMKRADGVGGFIEGIREVREELTNLWEVGRAEAHAFFGGLQSDWDQDFFQWFEQRSFDLAELFVNLWLSVLKEIQQSISRQLSRGLLELLTRGLLSAFSGGGTSGGSAQGPVFSPPDTGGVGENSLVGSSGFAPSRYGSGGSVQMNVVVQAADAQSVSALVARNPEAFAAGIVKVVSSNRQVATALRAALS